MRNVLRTSIGLLCAVALAWLAALSPARAQSSAQTLTAFEFVAAPTETCAAFGRGLEDFFRALDRGLRFQTGAAGLSVVAPPDRAERRAVAVAQALTRRQPLHALAADCARQPPHGDDPVRSAAVAARLAAFVDEIAPADAQPAALAEALTAQFTAGALLLAEARDDGRLEFGFAPDWAQSLTSGPSTVAALSGPAPLAASSPAPSAVTTRAQAGLGVLGAVLAALALLGAGAAAAYAVVRLVRQTAEAESDRRADLEWRVERYAAALAAASQRIALLEERLSERLEGDAALVPLDAVIDRVQQTHAQACDEAVQAAEVALRAELERRLHPTVAFLGRLRSGAGAARRAEPLPRPPVGGEAPLAREMRHRIAWIVSDWFEEFEARAVDAMLAPDPRGDAGEAQAGKVARRKRAARPDRDAQIEA